MIELSEWGNYGYPVILLSIEEAEAYIESHKLDNFLSWYKKGKKGYTFPIMVWDRHCDKVSHQPINNEMAPSHKRTLQHAVYTYEES